MNSSDNIDKLYKIEDAQEKATRNRLKLLSKVTEKKYKCSFCLYSSDNALIVQQHVITHYVKPQVCPYCQEVPTVKYHRKTLYRPDKSRFKAKECNVVFTRNSDKCDVVFTANYVCELCGKKFRCILHSKEKKRQIILLSSQKENNICGKALKNKA